MEEFSGKVIGIIDGDTVRVLREGREVRIRLEGIDCPESTQPFGTSAKHATSDLAFEKTVAVKVKGTDRYGRLLADVVLPGDTILNRELVRLGYAWWFKKYSRDESLDKLEADARKARRGLWADKNPIPPWDWRNTHRQAPGLIEQPSEVESNGVEIVGLLPNPVGEDRGHEEVALMNLTTQEVSLNRWTLRDRAGNEFALFGTIAAKARRSIKMIDPSMPLNNAGDEVMLIDGDGVVRSRASYLGRDVAEGRQIEFPR